MSDEHCELSTVEQYLGGQMSADVAARVGSHLGSCAACAELVAHARPAAAGDETRDTRTVAEPSPGTDPAPGKGSLPLEPGVAFGRYVLLDHLGEGGMGVVCAAYDRELRRRVAVKFLRVDREAHQDGAAEVRLLREAQAMARLAHPNVVPVFDTGTVAGRVFLAMEYVDGATLRQWLKARPRSIREILDVFLTAGAGLAAAHGRGLVHRDFKPDNVLVGADGRPRVTDFGLAQAADAAAKSAPPQQAATTALVGDALATPLTEAGAVMGTPAYLAPEQHRGEVVDARSDQFAFCVALYGALYGEHPFGGNKAQRKERVLRGDVRPVPSGTKVKPWLRRVLVRGLSLDPAARFPSMEALLVALRADPAAVRRRYLAVGAAVVATVLLGVGGFAVWGQPITTCKGSDRALAGIWDGQARAALRDAFLATGTPYAGSTWASVEQALDAYAVSLVRSRTEACEATNVRGEQSEETFQLRTICLDDRLRALKAVTQLFSVADPVIVEKAPQAVGTLPSIASCDNLTALHSKTPMPDDPVVRAEIDTTLDRLARASALAGAGKYKDAAEVVDGALVAARAVDFLPLRSAALLTTGRILDRLGEAPRAVADLDEAFAAAMESFDDETAAQVAIMLVRVHGKGANRFDLAHQWQAIAAPLLRRLKDAGALEATLLHEVAVLHIVEGKVAEAVDAGQRAVAFRERILGPHHIDTISSLNNLGRFIELAGRPREAIAILEQTATAMIAAVGPAHPFLAETYNNLALSLMSVGEVQRAVVMAKQALEIRRPLGESSQGFGLGLATLAEASNAASDFVAAIEAADRALAIFAEVGAPPYLVQETQCIRARALLGQGRLDDAFAASIAARTLAEGDAPAGKGLALFVLGSVRLTRGDATAASVDLGEALAIMESGKARQDTLQDVRLALARAELALGHVDRARSFAQDAERGYSAIQHRNGQTIAREFLGKLDARR